MKDLGEPALQARRQRSLLSRLVTVLGLAFFAVELAVLAVFTYFYWSSLRDDRVEHLAHYATAVHGHVRQAFLRGPESADAVDANLEAALQGKRQDPRQRRQMWIPPAGAPVQVWVFTPNGAFHFARSGHLLPPEESRRQGEIPPEAAAFLAAGQLASRVAVHRDRIVRVEPLTSGSAGEEKLAPDKAVLYLETSLGDVQRQVVTYGLVAFGTGAVALLITALITIGYLRRSLLLPLSRIIHADNAARRQDEARAVIDEGDIPDDEVGQIMRSRNHLFQAMTQAQRDLDGKNAELQKQREELRGWGRELEDLVQDKTAALLRARDMLHRTEKLAAVGRLAANVAHEINNPLASIAGYAEEAREDLSGDAENAEVVASLKTIEEQAFRCKDILKRLLGLARSDPVTLAPIDLSVLVRETVALAEHGARKRGVELTLDLPAESGPTLSSSAGSLQQVTLNLVENAIDAAIQGDEDSPWVRVSLREDTERQEVALVVADSGRGIPTAVRGRVFDPFYTTKPVGRGTGLGLAICQSLVERLGGRIEIEGEAPDRAGATFVVWIPRSPRPRSLPNAPGASVVDGSSLVEAHMRDAVGSADPDA